MTSAAISITDIHNLVAEDFSQANQLIEKSLHTEVDLISAISQHILCSGGKRLRPLVTFLTARALGYQGNEHIILAVVIEFLHTATLLHDDVVDDSALRRGKQTANVQWGNAASVLVGDFLYSRAFQLLNQLKNILIYDILAQATNTIAQGEVMQLVRRYQIDLSLEDYLEMIRCKTAMLFVAASESAAVLIQPQPLQAAMRNYGLHLGIAFQMIDDWLDYAVIADDSGKNPGDDLAEGKITLPIIYALQNASLAEQQYLRTALQNGDIRKLPEVLQIIQTTGADSAVQAAAKTQIKQAKQALHPLADSVYKQALFDLADFAVQRCY